jgi:peptide/nickel transport system ATP-binding protein
LNNPQPYAARRLSMALLEVRNLSVGIKRRNEILRAVDRISFTVDAGEIVALAGESGCGKSLTALSIPRLLPPAAVILGGDISYNGVSLSSLDEDALCRLRGKDISIIFQESRQSLNPLTRIGSQIAETLELHGEKNKKAAKAAALDMIAKLGLPEPERIFFAFPHQLSGGMCQRVMIGIAAICRPKLLIADEPSTALDAAAQSQILSLLGEINHDFDTSIFFISHDLSAARRFCRRFMVMYAGKIIEEGPVEALFLEPAHPYTIGLIGATPGRERRGAPLANIPGKIPTIEEKLPGCPFAPRCSRVESRCLEAFPPETDLGGGHRARCFLTGAGHA